MRDHASGTLTEALAQRIDAVMREIEQAKRERADASARVARARLAVAQTVKRQARAAERSR